jgi:hypothetical protein
MCPGWLQGAEPKVRQQEFEELFSIAVPIIVMYWPHKCAKSLFLILEDLNKNTCNDMAEMIEKEWKIIQETISFTLSLRYQLSLPFDELDTDISGSKT